MFDTFIGVLGALAVKEIYDDLVRRYESWKFKREMEDWKTFKQHLEDIDADDED